MTDISGPIERLFAKWQRNRAWISSAWGQAWHNFTAHGGRLIPEYRAKYEELEIARRAEERD